jgi:peptide/nickel transport system ATP-binding protein
VCAALPHRLSGGQRQRVLIAMAMMAYPKLLVADEPTTALDVTTQARILDLLRNLAHEQETAMAILFITHDLGVAASLADRLVVLYDGRVAEVGTVRDIVRHPSHPYTAGLLATRFDFNSDRTRPLPTLPGERRRLADATNACSYAGRCPLEQADCTDVRPPLRPSTMHAGGVACLHAEEMPSMRGRSEAPSAWPFVAIEPSPVLTLTRVSKSFALEGTTLWGGPQPNPILRSIDLTIKAGECVALVGESGSGKTTTLRIAAGLLAPDEGVVSRADLSPQVIFQDVMGSLTPWLPIGEQIEERMRARGVPANTRDRAVRETLELVGLDPALMSALPSELSGGQAQRAAVARAIVVPPKLLLCDEPISATDVSLSATTLNLLGDLRRRLGMAMLFVTHDLSAARIIADRIAVLHDGTLVEVGDPDSVIAAPKNPYTKSLVAAVPRFNPDLIR